MDELTDGTVGSVDTAMGAAIGPYWESRLMWQRTFASGFIVVALVALIAGCAGPSVGSSKSAPAAYAGDLTGTWNGLTWWIGGFYYEDESTILLQIKEDGTYTVTMRPMAVGSNIAKASSWSGTVVQKGRLVVNGPVFSPSCLAGGS